LFVLSCRCQQCGTESAQPSLFYELELNIAGHKTLADCLEEFLKEEKLEGADRYHCTVCKSKQDATRSMKLDVLPPVLNLALMRFVFDRSLFFYSSTLFLAMCMLKDEPRNS